MKLLSNGRWVALLALPSLVNAQVFVANTFQDTNITSGDEVIFDINGPTPVGPEVEFPSWPVGLYDIDVSESSIKFTMVNNSGASDLVLPEGRFDRYYFDLNLPVLEAVLDSPIGGIAPFVTVSVIEGVYFLDVTDRFGTNIAVPIPYPNGVVLVEVGPGADLSTLGDEVNILLNPQPPTPEVYLANTFEHATITSGQEAIFDTIGPTPVTDEIEFPSWPVNLYDIDVSETSVKLTLVNNSAASALVLAEGSYDRYYFQLPFDVLGAIVDNPTGGIAPFVSVSVLPREYSLDVVDVLGRDIVVPIPFVTGGLRVEIGPGADLSTLGDEVVVMINPPVFVANTFQDTIITEGDETLFAVIGPTALIDGTEFPSWPVGLYDIDVSESSIKFTMVNNAAASDLVLPPARFDRYYFDLPFPVEGAVVLAPSGGIAPFVSVSVLAPGFNLDVADRFNTSVPLPIAYSSGGLFVQIGPGADLSNIGDEINILLNPTVSVANTFQDTNLTGGAETVYQVAGPTFVGDSTEFRSFPGIYDIDVSAETVLFTLVNNSAVTDLVLPDNRFDRYYFHLPFVLEGATVVEPKGAIAEFTTVEVLPPGFILDAEDLFSTMIPVPIDFPNGALQVTVGPGANLTNIGESITISLTPLIPTLAPSPVPSSQPTAAPTVATAISTDAPTPGSTAVPTAPTSGSSPMSLFCSAVLVSVLNMILAV